MLKPAIVGILGAFIALNSHADETAELTSIPAPWTATDGAVIDFTVLRKGKPFGTHKLSFDRDEGGELTVTTDVDLQVKFGPITAFKYRLDSVENWWKGSWSLCPESPTMTDVRARSWPRSRTIN